ncbi:MAG TPA: glycosyltransferase family 2 protein, partial [Puia sp.]|nr:glycosyltransferase family 2 protein [Puia sp.]
ASTYANKEIVVSDNASTDESVNYLKAQFPQVRIIQLSRNFGFSIGYNETLKQVQADYYVLLNSDVEVGSGWIEPVIQLMEKDLTIGACQPKILSHANKCYFEYAGAAGGWLDCLGYPFARGRIFDVCEKDHGQYDQSEPVFWASGAALFVRAPLYHEIDGLEGYFFAHMEEIDFCWRLQLAGYSVYACPQSVVYHVGGGTLPKGNERKVFLNFRNNMIMLAKNLPYGQMIWKIPFRIFLDIVSAWKSLFAGEWTYFKAIFEAHLAFVKWVFFKQKESNFPRKRKAQLSGWFQRSVVWKHFVRGQKTFSEIVGGKR